HQVVELRVAQLERRLHFGLDDAFALILQGLELLTDLRQELEAAVLREHTNEILGVAAKLAREDRDEQASDLRVGKTGIGNRGAYPGVLGDLGKRAERLGPLGESTRLVGELERRLGIGTRDSTGLGHLQLALDRVEELAVRPGIDLPAQDLLGAGYRQ